MIFNKIFSKSYRSIISLVFLITTSITLGLVIKRQEVFALNKVVNWSFSGNSTGWTATNDNGTNVCGDNNSSTGDTAFATFAYNSGTFAAVTSANKNTNFRGMIHQQVTAPGSGNVIAKGRLKYYTSGASWSTANTSWVRLDVYASNNSTFVGNLVCVSFNSNQDATSSWSNNISLTGGTTYTIRATMRIRVGSSNSAVTTYMDNIEVNFAPVGLTSSAPGDSTNVTLMWTPSSSVSGGPGLNDSTPYKVYRNGAFLSNASSATYTDTTTTGNTSYSYWVTDVDANSIESGSSAGTTKLTLPGTPTTPTFSSVTQSSMTVGWSAPSGGVASYKLDRCQGTSCSDFSQITSGETGLSYPDSSLSSATLYRYRVRGTNDTGDGAYSGIGEQATSSAPSISISMATSGSVPFGIVGLNEIHDTTSGDLNNVQTVSVDTGPVDLDISTTAFYDQFDPPATMSMSLGASNGTDTVKFEFSKDAADWTIFEIEDSNYTLDTNVSQGNTRDVYFRLTSPTGFDTATYNTYSSIVTIMASVPE